MATNASELQAYFADLDAKEEAEAKALGMDPDTLRLSRQPFVKENRRALRVASQEAEATGEPVRSILYEPMRMQELFARGETMVPPSMQRVAPLSPQQSRARSRSALGLEFPMERLREPVDMPETVPSLSMPNGMPAKTSDLAALQKLMSPGSLASPIPVASAPVKADVPAPMTGAIAATTPTQPAPPAGTSSTVKAPPVQPPADGSGGDDEMGRLGLGQALVRALEGSGSVISGQNLRSGAAETLGERMKQIEALRAKREEQGITDTRERANNRAQVDYLISRFPDRAEDLQKLYGMTGKPNFAQMLRVEEQVALDKARKATEEVKPVVALRGAEVKEAGQAEKELEGESKRKEREARTAKIYKDMEIAGAKLALDERKAIQAAEQAADPFKKLESLNTIADKKEFGGFTTLAGDLADLERAAPGFVTRGEVPDWLTREQQLLGQNWPTSADPRVVKFLAAYGKLANAERHRLYGSAQTDGELRSFMQQLNSSPLSAGPKVLAQQVKSFANAAGRVAKGRLTRYNNVFGAENVDTVFAPEWKPLFDAGGVFASQGTPFAAPARAAAPAATGAARPQKPADKPGTKTLWNKKRGIWVQYGPEAEAKARADNAVED